MLEQIESALSNIKKLNPGHTEKKLEARRSHRLQKVVIANRGEIAKRFLLSLREDGIPSVAVVTSVDVGQSWYGQADEVIFIGDLGNYTNIPTIIAAAIFVDANAIYPGYGFLSENINFVRAIEEANNAYGKNIIFMGPDASIMDAIGDKLAARALARAHGVPLFEGSDSISSIEDAEQTASKIGYPVIVKLSAGGGGKGMQPVYKKEELPTAIEYCQRIGKTLYNDDTYYLERFIEKPVHMEVQIFNGTAIGIRKCAVQRRNQKVVEESGDAFLDSHLILSLLAAAENMARISGYAKGAGAGTVEFLYDPDSMHFGFLEMNARLQVEHPVTDQSLRIDLAKWQILYFDGREYEIPYNHTLQNRFVRKSHAIECRIYAEDPENDYAPSPGKIHDLELPTFNAIRCDFGFGKGDSILPHYDPMIGKLITHGTTRAEAIVRMERALGELYVRGITTNINQLLSIVRNSDFKKGSYTNRILADNESLEKNRPDEFVAVKAAIFGTLAENAHLIQEAADECILSRDLENTVVSRKFSRLPAGYRVKVYDHTFDIELIQTTLDTFYVYVDGDFSGEVEILSRVEGTDDYLIRFGVKSYPVRLDRRPALSIIRMQDDRGQINYFKMQINALGDGERGDPEGLMRAPFQGTFVKFAKDSRTHRELNIGSRVQKGEPIIVLSAMKMETTINAPVEGRITFLLEDGDTSRLQIGKTADGLIIGKSIGEGEIIFIIEEEDGEKKTENQNRKIKERTKKESEGTLENLYAENIEELILKEPAKHIPVLMKLIKAYFHGFLSGDKLIRKIDAIFQSIPTSVWRSLKGDFPEHDIASIIATYSSVKQIYSPAMGTNLSYFGELNSYLSHWLDQNEEWRPTHIFKATMTLLFRDYHVYNWLPGVGGDINRTKLAFFNILHAYHSCLENPHVIRTLVEILSHVEGPERKTISALKRLILQEQAERDDTLANFTMKVLQSMDAPRINRDMAPVVSRQYMREFIKFISDPLASFDHIKKREFLASIEDSLQNPSSDLIPKNLSKSFAAELSEKLKGLQKNYHVWRLYSPLPDVVLYRLKSIDQPQNVHYTCITVVEDMKLTKNVHDEIEASPPTERACINAGKILRAYQIISKCNSNWIEIFIPDRDVVLDIAGSNSQIFNIKSILLIASRVNRFFTNAGIERTLVHMNVRSPFGGETERKMILLTQKDGRLVADILQDYDKRNPYFAGEEKVADQRLFDRDKWPVEVWVKEAFDPDTADELLIPSIDRIEWTNPKTKVKGFKPVGGKIYRGDVGRFPALFYMKDSRIAGGASGNLEGLKYVAAAYLAYKLNLPLYVWNDGAGANIKEGMVSLNRAGQGFMVNSLLGARVYPDQFQRYTSEHPDPVVRAMFKEIDREYQLPATADNKKPERNFIVAIGTGSSTGLDVYGSSQHAIQIMIDSDQSYRVLTGSNVIKSVTGEDLTNYEIGGARVMSKWTGTVDLVANDKIELLSYIRRIQEIFCEEENASGIHRLDNKNLIPENYDPDLDVISEELIRRNVDNGYFISFKGEFYGTGPLVAGFARMGGRHVLIMGPRTHFGVRSFASTTRAKELFQIALKTNSHQILVFGESWYQRTANEDDLAIRARLDFVRTLHKKKGIRIHIITHPIGLKQVMINASADSVIFVKPANIDSKDLMLAKKVATFIVNSLPEAFDLSHRVIHYDMINEKSHPFSTEAGGVPRIPADTAQPYDMIEQVIKPIFDKESFLEFYSEMNDPITGPSLITGLARLNGLTVGIIADQPNIMGGAPDAPGTEKFRIFTELLSRNRIPTVMLSNAPGFVPGAKQERLRIQQIGAESLDVNILSQMPVVSVVLNQNYGGRQIQAFSRFLRPGIIYLALERSVLAVMGATASFDLFKGAEYQQLMSENKLEEAKNLRQNYIHDYNTKAAASNDAMNTGILDWTVPDISELRKHIIRAMEKAIRDARAVFETHYAGMGDMERHAGAAALLLENAGIASRVTTDGVLILEDGSTLDPKKVLSHFRADIDLKKLTES